MTANISTWVSSFNVETARQVLFDLTFTQLAMRSLFAAPFFLGYVLGVPAPGRFELRATGSLTSWLATESSYALQGVLKNIGPNGADASGADAGIVVASPSTSSPDCA